MTRASQSSADTPTRQSSAETTTRRLLACGAIGAVGFVAVFLVDGATRPGYDPTYHPVSALSLGERGWLQTLNFVVTGALMVAFAIGLRRRLRPGPAAAAGPLLIGLFGLSLVASGAFAMDPMRGYPPGTPPGDPGTPSWQHVAHDDLGAVVFLCVPLACFVLARRFARPPTRRVWVGYSIATGLAGIALLVVFGLAWEADHPQTGLIQRVMIFVDWTWLGLLSWATARRASDGP
jgi:hypothetical protein